jgi:hypothetical protein
MDSLISYLLPNSSHFRSLFRSLRSFALVILLAAPLSSSYNIDQTCTKYVDNINAAVAEAQTELQNAATQIMTTKWVEADFGPNDILGALFSGGLTEDQRTTLSSQS